MSKNKKSDTLLITGGSGMVGSAIEKIATENNIDAVFVSSRAFNLTDAAETKKMFQKIKPTKVIHLAAKVGGVKANSEYLADFFDQNILINTNVIKEASLHGVQNLVSLLSTCVYPDEKWVTYPLTEKQLHLGPPHSSNFAYAYAKRMLEVQSRAYRIQHKRNYTTAIPNNIYGPNDNFDLENSHVVPAVIRKIWEAKLKNTNVTFWGDGKALREFTHAEDIAACLLKMMGYLGQQLYTSEIPANIGTAEEISILELVETVAKIFDFKNEIIWDTTKPAGQFRKPSSKNRITHSYKTFQTGIEETCKWFRETYPNIRGL